MGVRDRVKTSFVIFDIRALWRSGLILFKIFNYKTIWSNKIQWWVIVKISNWFIRISNFEKAIIKIRVRINIFHQLIIRIRWQLDTVSQTCQSLQLSRIIVLLSRYCTVPSHRQYPVQYSLDQKRFLFDFVTTSSSNYCTAGPTTRSQAVARIADRTPKNCRGHVT